MFNRIHLVLRLVLEFMDKYPFVEDFLKDMKNVKRPHNLTLSTAIHLLWTRLKTIPESLSRNLTKTEVEPKHGMAFTKMSKSTQSSGSLGTCESCSMAGRTIIELIRGMDLVLRENELISTAAAERELTKLDLFEKTQWSVMSRLMAAINQDARMILDLMRETSLKSEATRSELENQVKNLEAELLLRKVESSASESRNVKTASRLKDVLQELENLRNEGSLARERNMEMSNSCKIAQTRISLLEECNRILQYQTVAVAECKRSVEKSLKECREEKENLGVLLRVSHNENNAVSRAF
ncbi:uncharacterized protein LOC112495110 [Cephus cinctus]|uniref:Uncharacterized protein LOC112495110 n=1 Tax=Cephus cinctus TaxID=211228 RepID=A0AAJ7RSF6_CEPCN|nr:uncharacterized protein LOC112495110 [Cephus cinctus]